MTKSFFDGLTPVFLVQAVLSIIIVVAFVYEELTVHSVDSDLKVLTFGIIGYWIGAIVEAKSSQLSNGVMKNGKQS